ncbi:SdrD B-like domain-containing protein [Methanobacterium oryzae]|uniref:SdrD B-like domain-containing protein n=1 Tax=Methanobacterium oryzae TaxID=69540 RepID=UPI003D21EB42
MLFAFAIAICLTGAVSATDSVTDKNCDTKYPWDNKCDWNGEEKNAYDQKCDNLNYKKDNARYEEPKCDTCGNYGYKCNCDEERKYDACRNTADDLKCDEKPICDTCRNTVDNCKCDEKPKCVTCKNATIGDRVWNDSNANGIQDQNETGIAGITVNLWTNVNNAPGSIIKTTTTNATGNYVFTNVVPGAYWLQFLVPDALGEWIFSPQNQGTNDALDSDANATGIAGLICLVCGECDPNWDAGLYQAAKLGDRVWNDLNANGIQDAGEPGIAGIIVNLWTSANNAPVNIVKTTTTDANGNYIFANVVPGAYQLQFVVPQAFGEWIFTLQNQGTDDTIDSDAAANGITSVIGLAAGEEDVTWDAGLYQYATLGNRVWMEITKNGLQDANEPGVAGVTVNLWTNVNNAPGIIIKTTTTDANGNYLFTNIVPGTYWLQFVLPNAISSWIFALQNQGTDDAIDSDADANGIAGPIELISGEVDLTWDAGLDPGSAAGGDEEPTDEEPKDGAAAGEEIIPEEVAAAGEEEALEENVAAAGEPEQVSAAEVGMQETGIPVNYLILALLMVLGGLFGVKRK